MALSDEELDEAIYEATAMILDQEGAVYPFPETDPHWWGIYLDIKRN